MSNAKHKARLNVRILDESDAERELDTLARRWGSYESLLEKAEREALSADERAQFRRMKNLRFLTHRAA